MVKVENIKVAVRVRPFNSRETGKKCRAVVVMRDKTTMLYHPASSAAPPRSFKFDQSYWSHDGYRTNEHGYLEATSSKYIDQKRLFDELGAGLLDNAWSGYNCTLFAYGQTGSGKTYSIMGTGVNKGLVPMIGESLFEEIESKGKQDGIIYQVTISMMEIYNEKVRDLLQKEGQPNKGLPVRQSPSSGFYVEGLTSSPVADYRDIAHQISLGNKHRTFAATRMNETSSRAHTIVTISFLQNFLQKNKTTQSKIVLVDLAGSERASQTGATGVRFVESKNINRSLMTLGTVIKNLCAHASGRTDQGPLPYRDSILTMLLKDSIGGNSKTIMMAAISPSDEDYEQTLSTLRYAERVKSIKNWARMNVAATDELIKDLLSEKEALLLKLKNRPDSQLGYTEDEILKLKQDQMKEIQQLKNEMHNVEAAWKKRLTEARQQIETRIEEERREKKEREEMPHLYNLNEDSALTGKVYYLIREGKQELIGNSRSEQLPSIQLHGPSIAKEHAFLQSRKCVVTLHPLHGSVRVNGAEVNKETVLRHQDRVFFGGNNLFIFHHPQEEMRLMKEGKVIKAIGYEAAQEEIGNNSHLTVSKDQEWLRQEVAEVMVRTHDANAMATVMNKAVKFDPVVITNLCLGHEGKGSEVYVRVHTGSGGEFIWSKEHFLDRYDLMIDMFQKFENDDPTWQPKSLTQDPFWEPLETPTLVGVAHLPLTSIAYMLDIDEQRIGIYDYQACHVGYLTVALVPCDELGQECSEDRAVEEPVDLLRTNITFKVKIAGATGIEKRFKSTWCHYTLYPDPQRYYTTEVTGSVPKYKYERTHKMTKLDHKMIAYLEEKSIMIEIYGRQKSSPDTKRNSSVNSYSIADDRRFSYEHPQIRSGAGSCVIAGSELEEERRLSNSSITSCNTMQSENKSGDDATDKDTVDTLIESLFPDIDTADVISDGGGSPDRSRKVMEEMRRGISSIMEEVIKRETNFRHGVNSPAASTTTNGSLVGAVQTSSSEMMYNERKLMTANRKMMKIQRLIEDRDDKMSEEIRRILKEEQ